MNAQTNFGGFKEFCVECEAAITSADKAAKQCTNCGTQLKYRRRERTAFDRLKRFSKINIKRTCFLRDLCYGY